MYSLSSSTSRFTTTVVVFLIEAIALLLVEVLVVGVAVGLVTKCTVSY